MNCIAINLKQVLLNCVQKTDDPVTPSSWVSVISLMGQ